MKRLLLTLMALLGMCYGASAQNVPTPSQVAIVCAANTSPPAPTVGMFYLVQCNSSGQLVTTGSGGGGGGTVTQGPAGASPWLMAIPDGVDVALGATTDGVWSGSGVSTITSTLRLLHNDIISSIAAGANIIGKVGIDQTTPGTTNGVAVNSSALPTGAATSANQPTNAAQGAAIAGATGNMAQAEALSTPPTYTTATINPLVMDPAGNLITSGQTLVITPVAMTVTTGSHAPGTVVGTKEQFQKTGPYGVIQSITVTSAKPVTVGLKAYIFASNPSNTTFTDASAIAIAAADAPLVLGALPLSPPDSGGANNTVWSVQNVGIAFSGTNIYIAVVVTGSASFSPVATTDFSMRVTVKF